MQMKNRVKEFRKKMGYSLHELSLLSGVAAQDISAVENGKKPAFPKWREGINLSLGVDESVLFPEVKKGEGKHENSCE